MAIKLIRIEVGPDLEKNPDSKETNRTLVWSRETRQWSEENQKGGLFPGEIKFIAALEEVRQKLGHTV